MIPKTMVKEIDKILKGFLCCKGEIKRGKAKVAWKFVCSPKGQGGLGLRDFGTWNKVLLIKNLWNIAAGKNTLWVKWVNEELKEKMECRDLSNSWDTLVDQYANKVCNNSIRSILRRIVLSTAVHNIWKERNARNFIGEVKDGKIMLNLIMENVKL
ncbi:hypothetical protein Tco_0644147 [Tanacetum coccineum]